MNAMAACLHARKIELIFVVLKFHDAYGKRISIIIHIRFEEGTLPILMG